MAALQLRPGARFDPDAFTAFLAAQSDMGTKWLPRFVRIAETLPITATSKVLIRVLRAERWHGSDPVWWSPDRPGAGYRRLEPSDTATLDAAVQGRSDASVATE
jgi:fatty-acyl-CoA synthase